MRRFVALAKQINKDLAAKATYSGCDIDIYLQAFAIEARVGYASENRSEAHLSTAMHVRAGWSAPAGAAVVASRLALYATLVKAGATAPLGAPSADEAASLAKRILLAWATKGMRDAAGRVISLGDFSGRNAAEPSRR